MRNELAAVAAPSQSNQNLPLNPFDLLGVPRAFLLDEHALETKYFELSKQWHPDRFAASGNKEKQIKSQEMSAQLNQAYTAIRTRENRLDALLAVAGATSEKTNNDQSKIIPLDLAEEYFELQELAAEDHAQALAKAAQFKQKIEVKTAAINQSIYQLAATTDWMNPDRKNLDSILQQKQELAYLVSLIRNLERIGLA